MLISMQVLRNTLNIAVGAEDNLYARVSHDEFMTYSAKIEEYFENPANQGNKLYELLRDTFDLKKLNTGLTVTPVIHDLIGDIYATLYDDVVPDNTKRSSKHSNPKLLQQQ